MKESISSNITKVIKKSAKQEKGSITLFVLITMLFFLAIVLLVYMEIGNKKQAQVNDIQKIQSEYQVSASQMDDIYEEIENKTAISVNFENN